MVRASELVIGSTVDLTLLVKTSEKKLTAAKKPYLTMLLTTGSDDISANMWDYYDPNVPEPNTILDVRAKVGEYAGKKQLTINSLSINTTVAIQTFLPQGNFNVGDYVQHARTLMSCIENSVLKELTVDIFETYLDHWLIKPGAKGIHHAYVAGNLKHCVDTAFKAKAIAESIPECNTDLCVAGALLHDIGKLFTYDFDQVIINMTIPGILMDHIVIGVQIVENHKMPENAHIAELLKHIIVSHHNEQAFGSPVTPKFVEAIVVAYADVIDARIESLLEESRKAPEGSHTTGKMWIFDNHPMYTPDYVSSILSRK